MNPLVAALVAVSLQTAAAPSALTSHLEEARRVGLPVSFLEERSGAIELAFHDASSWSRSFLTPARDSDPQTLALHAASYLQGAELRPVRELPVDLSEYYFHSLLEGALYQEVVADSELGRWLVERSESLMSEVPASSRLAALVDAQASFGAHLLSVLLLIHTRDLERRQSGGSFCNALRQRAPLFGLWEAAFAAQPFPGSYYVEAGGLAAGHTVTTRAVLAPEDKVRLVAAVLEGRYRGDAESDFGETLCGEAGR